MCMDRPIKSTEKGREYVQPQYILDSINNLFLLPTKPYMPGVPAPAHLSPFIDDAETGYIPDRQREINSLAGIETAANVEEFSSDSDEEKEGENIQVPVEQRTVLLQRRSPCRCAVSQAHSKGQRTEEED